MGKPAANFKGSFTNTPVLYGATVPTVSGVVLPVLIEGAPPLRMGDPLPGGGDSIVIGSTSVLIHGQPAARILDSTSQGGSILIGANTVLIGG